MRYKMPALVRLHIDKHGDAHTVRLPEMPMPGELIELADGTRVVVRQIEPSQGGIVVAEVRVKLA
jgi:hypothetical protein